MIYLIFSWWKHQKIGCPTRYVWFTAVDKLPEMQPFHFEADK